MTNFAGYIEFRTDDRDTSSPAPSRIVQDEVFDLIANTNAFATGGSSSGFPISWLLVKDVPVPEPSVLALFGLGFLGLGMVRRRRAS